MLIYLDTNVVIYAVENPAVLGAKAQARLQAISASDRIALSELTRTECCSYPLRQGDFALLRLYDRFFLRSDVPGDETSTEMPEERLMTSTADRASKKNRR